MDGFRNGLQSFGLLIARLGLGGILLLHGWLHWRVGVPRYVETLTAVGAPYAQIAAWATIIFELVAGIFLIVGALTRFIGVGVITLSVLNISYFRYSLGPELVRPDGSYNGGYEYDVALGLLGLLLFVCGAGVISIDRLFTRKKPVTEEDQVDAPTVVSVPTRP
jgi:putative oxidoreductase